MIYLSRPYICCFLYFYFWISFSTFYVHGNICVFRRVENGHDNSSAVTIINDADVQDGRGGHSSGNDIDVFENGPSGGDEFAAVKVGMCVCVCVWVCVSMCVYVRAYYMQVCTNVCLTINITTQHQQFQRILLYNLKRYCLWDDNCIFFLLLSLWLFMLLIFLFQFSSSYQFHLLNPKTLGDLFTIFKSLLMEKLSILNSICWL